MADAEDKAATASPPTSTNEKGQAVNQTPANAEPGPEEPKKRRPERTATFQDYLRVFKYASNWDFLAYGAGFIASIGAGITLPLMNVVFGKFVGNFSDFSRDPETAKEQFESNLNKLSLYMLALFICRLALNYINKFAFRMIGIRISSAIRLAYLEALFAQSVHVLDSLPPGYATTTITTTANTLQLGISEKLGVFVEFNATMIAAIIIAFIRSWRLTLVTASAILFIMITIGLLLPSIVKIQGRMTKAESKSAAVASESMASLRMIVACGAESRMVKKYHQFVEDAAAHARANGPLVSTQFALVFFAVYSAFGLAFWYGTKLYADGTLTDIGTIVVVLFSVMMVLFSIERTSTPLMAVGKATVAACQFFIVIDAPRPESGHLQEPDVTASEDIVLENITFAYPSRPHVKILDDLDLRIEKGKITAIVGPSGSGKSTIVGLIQRWYNLKEQYVLEKAVEKNKKKKKDDDESEPDANDATAEEEEIPDGPLVDLTGSVTTCGHSLDDINIKWWRSQIGLVQQEPFLFNETIYKNVANGLIGTVWEDESEDKKRQMVQEACKEAFADEFIDKLPQNYDTAVGDSGAKLSGGQRQRIAIARSIVRQPKILILDEATSAIDVRGERIVQAALDRVAKNRTTITIAHRLSTIKKADRIVVLKKGRVVESGTHETLLAQADGVYAGLVNAQALSLGEPTEAGDNLEKEAEQAELVREKSKAQSTAEEKKSKENESERGLFDGFGRLFYETRSHWWMMILTLLFAALAAAAMPLQAWLFAKVIVIFGAPSRSKLLEDSKFWSKMWVTLASCVAVGYFGTFFFAMRTSAFIRSKYQASYFEDMLHQKPSYFDEEDHSQGTMTSRASGDPQQLEELMGMNMASVYMGIFSLVGSVAIAFSFGWKLALVALCVVVPILLACSYWRLRYEMVFNKMNDEVFAESSKFASESIGAFRTVASLTLEDATCRRFERLCHQHVITAYKKARWVSLLFGFSDSATLACQALIFYYGGRLLLSGEYSLESFFVSFMAVMNAGEATGQSLSFGPNAAQVRAAANRMLRMRESRLRDDVDDSEQIPDTDGGVKIELDNIHFKYPTRDVPVFQGLSLTVEKGQFAALVGASGCGKTSIISLLERFYDIEKGRILCNGKDITDLNVYQYRKHLSLVAQEATLFQGTLRENILLGVEESSVTNDELHQACRDASIHDFIVSLPEGYNTDIGSKGVTLSGGQKQRIAIARALIRQPDILLLDEATSSLDSESEKLVQAAFERAGKGRTMLVVAHRLATVQNADVIFVLGEGKLLEKGSHVELLKKRGVYWQMCQNQALDR